MTDSTTPRPPELVVDTNHVGLVQEALSALSTCYPEVNRTLRLARFTLDDTRLRYHAVTVRREHLNEILSLEERGGRRFSDTDLLLFGLRRTFAKTHGMVPLMGKNRDVAMVYPQAVGEPTAESKATVDPFPHRPDMLKPQGDPTNGQDIVVGAVDAAPTPSHLPTAGHARFVAGLIKHQAPAVKLRMRSNLSAIPGETTSWDVAVEIAHFVRKPADILNLSLGVTTEDDEPPLVLRRAIDELGPKVLVVAAAGNRVGVAPVTTIWPAAMTDVVAVGARTEYKSHFSPRKLWVDVTTDGVDVVSEYLTGTVVMANGSEVEFNGFASWSGTSFATATVSGTVAAKLSKLRADPNATAWQALEDVLDDEGSFIDRYVHVPCD